jgi:glutamate-5-semialdehyde dehydrogenase
MPAAQSSREIAAHANAGARAIGSAPAAVKNAVLERMADLLHEHTDDVIAANAADLAAARAGGIQGSLYERLAFDRDKLQSRIEALKNIARLPDPIGQVIEMKQLFNGLTAARVRVPIGVLLMIYEARPHVTVNAGAFAVKSGNAVICKGGSEALTCNRLLGSLWAEALRQAGLSPDVVQVVDLNHDDVEQLLTMKDDINLVIPRGGKELIRAVAEKSRIPVIKHFEGVCHVYIGDRADYRKALQVVLDSKLLMPSVCNAAETVLVNASVQNMLPDLIAALQRNGVQVRGCPVVCRAAPGVREAIEDDWYAEYLDKIYAVRVVDGLDAAMHHIATYGSGHTDVIVTENYSEARRFAREVDSAVVLVNASTMFCDGETLGMGAEIGISTDKLHARGPMGLNELTSYKHVIWGEGHIMGPAYR